MIVSSLDSWESSGSVPGLGSERVLMLHSAASSWLSVYCFGPERNSLDEKILRFKATKAEPVCIYEREKVKSE